MPALRKSPPQHRPADHRSWVGPELRLAEVCAAVDSALSATKVSIVLAAVLVAVLWNLAARPYALALLATMILFCVAASEAVRFRGRLTSDRSQSRTATILTVAAAVSGTAWGGMMLWAFAIAGGEQKLVLVGVLAVAISNVYRPGSMQRVCIAHLSPICAGGCLGLALVGDLTCVAIAMAIPPLGMTLLSRCRRLNDEISRGRADRIRLRVQHETIHELLLDFDENESDWLWHTDAEGRIKTADDMEQRSCPFEECADLPFASVLSNRKDARRSNGARAVLAAMAAHKPFRNQLVEIPQDGPSHWWRLSGKPIHDTSGHFSGYRGVGSNMTGARNSESRIAYLAEYDALTGFANRAHFQTFAGRQCAAAAADGHCRALLCLDLDGFKSVNDSLGHDGGDELLKQVAARITALAPAESFTARLGGDEFALWLQTTTPAKAESAASRIVAGLAAPFVINDSNVEIGVSVGIAFAPKHALDADTLLVRADLALYRAKSNGKGQACIFTEALETSQIERRKLESDLKLALARGEFELYYQPLIDVSEGRVGCFEALIRWKSPDRGYVSPAEFIPIAEAAGLIVPIGRWALFTACREAANWPDDIRVAVNVSPPQVRAADFLQDVTMALKTSGLHPTRLEIEVTEGVFLDKSAAALAALRNLRDRGIGVALDDFGTGYSSLNYLIDFPVAKIKIDRSFVTDLPNSETVQAVVDAMLALARKLAIRVVAEGVETKEQALALKRRRCDTLQGYLFSRPRPAKDVPDMLTTAAAVFREAIPTSIDSPLALALAARKLTV